jgi:hypothetical protein
LEGCGRERKEMERDREIERRICRRDREKSE